MDVRAAGAGSRWQRGALCGFALPIMRPATGFPWTLMQKRLNRSRLASCSAVLHGRRQRVTSSAVAAAYA